MMMKKIVASIDDALYTELMRRGKFDDTFDSFVQQAIATQLQAEDKEAAR
jgi:hypothetical protein